MNLLTMVRANIARRMGRAMLAICGVALGVAVGVSTACIAWGFEWNLEKTFELRGTDIMFSRINMRRPIPTTFDESLTARVRELPEVRKAAGMLWELMSIEEAPPMVTFGWEPGTYLWETLNFREGESPAESRRADAVYLGTLAARTLEKKPGDSIRIEDRTLQVAGVFESQALIENGMIILELPLLQEILEANHQINFINIRLQPGISTEASQSFCEELERRFRGMSAVRASDAGQNNLSIQLAKALSLATLILAAGFGTLGIANTMMSNVHERILEIGLLLAVGWKRRRILMLFLIESLSLSIAGAVLGVASGVGLAHALRLIEFLRDKITPRFAPEIGFAALAVACVAGLIGGIYPAWRATRVSPTRSLNGGFDA